MPVEGPGERGDHTGVELGARAPLQFGDGHLDRPGPAVGAGGGHRVEGVGDGDDPGALGDLGADQAVRVAAAVEAFVVVQDRGAGLAEEGDPADHLMAVLGMQFDDPAFLGGQRAVLAQQPGGDAELADVVQDAGEAQGLDAFVVHAEFPGDHHGGLSDAFAVAAGVAVLDVDGLHEGADGGLVGGAFAVVLGEDPPGHVHRQQHEQRGDRAVRAAPQHGHHQPGESVHRDRRERTGQQPAPGPAQRNAQGDHAQAAVEQAEDQAEREDGRTGGQQRVREVAADDGVPSAERPVHPGGGPHGERGLRGPPQAPRQRGPGLDRGEQGRGQRDERGGRRRQQERPGEQDGVEGAAETPAYDVLAGGVERGQQAERPPGGVQRRQRQEAEQRQQGRTGHIAARPRRYRLHRTPPRPCLSRLGA